MRVHGMANISFTSWEWFVGQVVSFHIELEQVSPAFEVMEVDISWILQERSFQVSSSWIHFRCARDRGRSRFRRCRLCSNQRFDQLFVLLLLLLHLLPLLLQQEVDASVASVNHSLYTAWNRRMRSRSRNLLFELVSLLFDHVEIGHGIISLFHCFLSLSLLDVKETLL